MNYLTDSLDGIELSLATGGGGGDGVRLAEAETSFGSSSKVSLLF
jgi:hypothetical protein